jgi:hypothetical protein
MSMTQHKIDYIPGAAELGDFDATSTAIGISPLGLTAVLPDKELQRTFDIYLENLKKPRADYTPYEMRIIGALIRLGRRSDAVPLVERFLRDRRPLEWNEWAEVVSTDPRRPLFIGDMPHAWVASDFVRSMLDAIAFDREDGSLVIGAGIPMSWLGEEELHVGPLVTYNGTIDVKMKRIAQHVEVSLSGSSSSSKILVRNPHDKPFRSARVDGKSVSGNGRDVVVAHLPARVVFTY